MTPFLNSWRPVSSALRVGAHVGLTWKSVKRTLSRCRRSRLRRLEDGIAVRGDVAVALVVGQDEDDVRRRRAWGSKTTPRPDRRRGQGCVSSWLKPPSADRRTRLCLRDVWYQRKLCSERAPRWVIDIGETKTARKPHAHSKSVQQAPVEVADQGAALAYRAQRAPEDRRGVHDAAEVNDLARRVGLIVAGAAIFADEDGKSGWPSASPTSRTPRIEGLRQDMQPGHVHLRVAPGQRQHLVAAGVADART